MSTLCVSVCLSATSMLNMSKTKWSRGFVFNWEPIGKCLQRVDWRRRCSVHFASAFIAVIFSQLMASSSASWRLNKLPSSFVSGHESIMCSMVCCSPQSQSGDEARPHLCILARHGPWPVQKRFNSVQEWRGRSKPGCWTSRNSEEDYALVTHVLLINIYSLALANQSAINVNAL